MFWFPARSGPGKKGRKRCPPEFLVRIHYPGDRPSRRSGRADLLSKNVRCGAAAAPRPSRMKDRRVVRFFPAPLPSRPAGRPQPTTTPVFAGRGRPTGPDGGLGTSPSLRRGVPSWRVSQTRVPRTQTPRSQLWGAGGRASPAPASCGRSYRLLYKNSLSSRVWKCLPPRPG